MGPVDFGLDDDEGGDRGDYGGDEGDMAGLVRGNYSDGGKRKKEGGEKRKILEKKRKGEKGVKKFKVRQSGGGRMRDHEADPEMKEMWDTVAGGDSEDDQEGLRTMDDDNFIDDSGVDPADRYGSGNEHSPSRAPQAEEGEEDEEIKELFKVGKKKKKNEKSAAEIALLVENVMAELEVVAEEDAELNRQGKPAISKLRKLSLLTDVLSKLVKTLQQEFLDHGVLTLLKNWLEPLPDGSLPNMNIRAAVLKILNDFPIDLEQYDRREQLKKSGLGKVIMFLSKSDEETTANRKLAKELVDKWSRPIFNKSTRFEDMKNFEDERVFRRPPVKKVMNKTAGMSSRDDDLDLAEFSQGSKSGQSSSRQHASRPEAMSMDFVVRPQSKVDPDEVRARAKQMVQDQRRAKYAYLKPFTLADEQEVTTTESTKAKAATSYKTQCGGSWHGEISLVVLRDKRAWCKASSHPRLQDHSGMGGEIYQPLIIQRVASAPGKVLMTGGYLILERPNAGIVLSTNARFYAIVKPLYEEIKPESWAWAWTDVKLTSPQMARETMYKLSLKHLLLQCVSSSDSRNPFVEYALQYAIAAARATFDKNKKDELHKLLLLGLDITILGCNEFYSYRNQIEARELPLTPESLASLPPFTSITFNVEESVNLPCVANGHLQGNEGAKEMDVVHIIAQTAHCIAQGKVGSGFDVSSAVYGSQRYIRFSPEVLASAQNAVRGTLIEDAIADVLKANWDHERTTFSLPPMMTLLLGEPGTGGSSTPSMVGAVKKWQKADPQNALDTWKKLSESNSALEFYLNTLTKLAENNYDTYRSAIDNCSKLTSEKWAEGVTEPNQIEVVKALLGARDAMLGIRCNMRKMGEAAGIPIEPESQTRLLDTTMNMEGVLLAGVPGAGGFDAVFAVTLGAASSNVIKVWSSLNVLALLVREDPCGVRLETNDPRATQITTAVSLMHIE
ncbi:UNVERIFIED_CONTAM: Phosphomevalonate kinase, peroxisomal [Sesamum latifolium]|uniref:phosphomevalonate kinase n=1 Tax=Sesamum latifolium TaxID=2727402 RepID=A0AAW2SMP5_9LAMI